jgi:hypothetical protein
MVVERNTGEDVEVVVVEDPEFEGRVNLPNVLRKLHSGGSEKKKASQASPSEHPKPTELIATGSSKGDRPADNVAPAASDIGESGERDEDENKKLEADPTCVEGPSSALGTSQAADPHDPPSEADAEADWVEEPEESGPSSDVPRRRNVFSKGGRFNPRMLFRHPSSVSPTPRSSAGRTPPARSPARSTADRRHHHSQTPSVGGSIRFASDVGQLRGEGSGGTPARTPPRSRTTSTAASTNDAGQF